MSGLTTIGSGGVAFGSSGVLFGVADTYPAYPIVGPTYDPDAQAFMTAAGLTDATHKNAVNQLTLDLKSAGLWTVMAAVYPLVGGNATAHQFNLKDPRTLAAAYPLLFTGSPMHSANGVWFNGTSQYANTQFNPLLRLPGKSFGFGTYLRQNPAGSGYVVDMGAIGSNGVYCSLVTRIGPYYGVNSQELLASMPTEKRGFWSGTNDGTTVRLRQQGTQLASSAAPDYPAVNATILLGAANYNEAPGLYSANEHAFAHLATRGLTVSEDTTLRTIVQTFQTTLARNIS